MTTLLLHPIKSRLKFLLAVTFGTGLMTSFVQPAQAAAPFLRTGVSYPETLEDERIVCSPILRAPSLSLSDCKKVARDFYREIYFQVHNFTPTGAFDVIRPTSIELLTDGSGFSKGLFEAIPGYIQLTGGYANNISIENAFAYQPIDMDTIAFFGAPLFTNYSTSPDQKGYIQNVQLSIYRRIKGGLNDPSCRSAQNLTGDTCWGIMAELWSYQVPLGFGVSSTSAQTPRTPQPNVFLRTNTFPRTLEPQRIICDSQTADATTTDTAWVKTCKKVAQEFYEQFKSDVGNFTGAGGFDVPASVEMIPDGSGYTRGLGAWPLYNDVVDGHTRTLQVENAFAYKPTDANTVVVMGAPLLTIARNRFSSPAYMHNIQLSVYRKTYEGMYAPWVCRSASNPFGINCWVLLNKLWMPQQELGRGVSSTP